VTRLLQRMQRSDGLASHPTKALALAASPLARAFEALVGVVDRRVGWDGLPKLAGLVALVGLRNVQPDLRPALRGLDNAFKPWATAATPPGAT